MAQTRTRFERTVTATALSSGSCVGILTIIPVASEELMEADEIGPSPKVPAFHYQHLLDQLEAGNNHTGCGTKVHAEDVTIDLAKCGECMERSLVTTK